MSQELTGAAGVPAWMPRSLDDAVVRVMPAVRWLVRRLTNVAWVTFVAGAIDAVLLGTVMPLLGLAVAVVVLAALAAILWQRHKLVQVVAAEEPIRAELQLLGALPGEASRVLAQAVEELESGSVLKRLRGARNFADVLRDALREHPLAGRAASLRGAFLGRGLVLTGWALALTVGLVLGIPVAAGAAAVVAFF